MPHNTDSPPSDEQLQLKDYEFLRAVLKDFAVRTYIMNQRLSRQIRVLIRMASLEKPEHLQNALHAVVLEDKHTLANVCNEQLQKLQDLNAPSVIIDGKKRHVKCADDIVKGLTGNLGADCLTDLVEELRQELLQDLLDLTTNFVQSDWPIGIFSDSDEEDRQLIDRLFKA